MVIWFTGLPGSGKTTIAERLSKNLQDTYILDGDVLRYGLNADLGFSLKDRDENIRRAAWVAKILSDNGKNVLATFITPLNKERQLARDIVGDGFKLVWIDCSLEECKRRDPKGLYARALLGEIKNFTGIDSPFETPLDEMADAFVETDTYTIEVCIENLWNDLKLNENCYLYNI